MSSLDACNACLLIVAYMEGASNDKLIDIYNGCGTAVNLGDYELVNCGNGCTTDGVPEHRTQFATAASASPVLAAGATWRVAHPSARLPAGHPANQTHTYLSNGDDAYAIMRKSTCAVCDDAVFLDTIGIFGRDPGSGWSVAGVSAATQDHTLIRKNSTTAGNCGNWAESAGTDASDSEWIVYPQGTWPSQAGSASASSSSASPSSPSSPSSSPTCPAGHVTTTTCGPAAPVTQSAALDRRPDRSRLVIAHWNSEWLFDGVCDPSASPWDGATDCVGYSHSLNQCDAAGAALHLQRMAAQMATFGADVIDVAEVESCEMLDGIGAALNALPSASATEYQSYMVTGTDTYLKQQVGMVSRLGPLGPLERTAAREAYPIDGSSSCGTPPHMGTTDVSKHYLARVHLELPASGGATEAVTLIVVGMHLKAIPTDPYSCNKREGQAKVLQALLSSALAESAYVVAMGDLNDFDGDACCLDAAGSMPTSRVLRMLKDPRATGSDELHSVVERLPRDQRYTDWWDHAPADGVDQGLAEHSSLDHMLLSSALYSRLTSVRIAHQTPPMDYSDHWPIVAEFNLSSLGGLMVASPPSPPLPPPFPPPPSPPPPSPSSPGSGDCAATTDAFNLPFGVAVVVIPFAIVGVVAVVLVIWQTWFRRRKAMPLMRNIEHSDGFRPSGLHATTTSSSTEMQTKPM